MAVFSVNIDDADVGRVISAMCANYGYEEKMFLVQHLQILQTLTKTLTFIVEVCLDGIKNRR